MDGDDVGLQVGSREGGGAADCSTCRRACAGQGEYVKVSSSRDSRIKVTS
jgi:hypothetical protein